MTNRTKKINLEDKGIAWHNLLAELHTVNLDEVCGVFLWFFHRVEHDKTATLCHSLHDKHTRHNRFCWEMSLEERLVACNVLDTYDCCCTNRNHLVNQLEWITMWKQVTNTSVVDYRFCIRIIDRSLNLMLTNNPAHLARKLIINSMSRTCSNDTTLDRFSNKCHVANHIKEFMTGTFVLPYNWLMLYISKFACIKTWNTEKVSKSIELVLWLFNLIDNDGIIHVTALDEVCLKQLHYIANEHEGTCRSNFTCEILYIIDCSKLGVDEL